VLTVTGLDNGKSLYIQYSTISTLINRRWNLLAGSRGSEVARSAHQ